MRRFLHFYTLSRCQRLTSHGKIVTDLYTKPTNKHQYLLHSSCHPIHTKCAIPFSLALGLRRICSTNETLTLRTNELIDYLYKGGYNRYFLQRKYNELTISHGQKHLRQWHFHTGQTTTCSLRYHLQPSPSFHLIHCSQTLPRRYFIPPLL